MTPYNENIHVKIELHFGSRHLSGFNNEVYSSWKPGNTEIVCEDKVDPGNTVIYCIEESQENEAPLLISISSSSNACYHNKQPKNQPGFVNWSKYLGHGVNKCR